MVYLAALAVMLIGKLTKLSQGLNIWEEFVGAQLHFQPLFTRATYWYNVAGKCRNKDHFRSVVENLAFASLLPPINNCLST